MQDVQLKIREEAKNFLSKGELDVIIGFEKGTMPLRASPAFVHSGNEVDRLIWNSFCENNLARYLTKLKGKRVGIVAKGCDSRSIVALLIEGQVKKEEVVIMGIPCQGMIDRRKLEKSLEGEVLEAEEKNEKVLLKGDGFKKVLKKEDYLYPCCRTCRYPNPVLADIVIGEKIDRKPELDEYAEAVQHEERSTSERRKYFERETGKCIRCYACRQACPMCYCEECFVDSSYPKWIGKGLDFSDLATWHIMRAYHQAGRCTNCGACERACPMEINLRFLTRKINKEVKDYFNFEAGLDMKASPPLSTFSEQDRQDFIDSGQTSAHSS